MFNRSLKRNHYPTLKVTSPSQNFFISFILLNLQWRAKKDYCRKSNLSKGIKGNINKEPSTCIKVSAMSKYFRITVSEVGVCDVSWVL